MFEKLAVMTEFCTAIKVLDDRDGSALHGVTGVAASLQDVALSTKPECEIPGEFALMVNGADSRQFLIGSLE